MLVTRSLFHAYMEISPTFCAASIFQHIRCWGDLSAIFTIFLQICRVNLKEETNILNNSTGIKETRALIEKRTH